MKKPCTNGALKGALDEENIIGSFRLKKLDQFNWIIQERVVAKKENSKGRPWKIIAYFPSLDQAAASLFDRVLLTGEDSPSIEALISEVRDARDYVARLVLRPLTAGSVDAEPGEIAKASVAENEPK